MEPQPKGVECPKPGTRNIIGKDNCMLSIALSGSSGHDVVRRKSMRLPKSANSQKRTEPQIIMRSDKSAKISVVLRESRHPESLPSNQVASSNQETYEDSQEPIGIVG